MEVDPEYAAALDRSIEEAKTPENLISFNMEDFMGYTPPKDAVGETKLNT